MNKNLYTNGFLLIFKIYFHNIRGTPSHLLRRAVWESLISANGHGHEMSEEYIRKRKGKVVPVLN
jgi:hypothetical protein